MKSLDNLEVLERDELIYLARLAEQSERYEEMIRFVRVFVSKSPNDLSVEERNILSVAYKNVVGTRRTSWRVLNSIERKEEKKGNSTHKAEAGEYREGVEQELKIYCDELLGILDSHLIPKANGSEARVFYWKMKGDYYRYMAEFTTGWMREQAIESAEKSYDSAFGLAKNELPPTHPTRLGLALNFSVFYFEIKEEKSKSCDMAKTAFDEAIPELDNITEDSYKDSTLILQLLRDNLTLWTSSEAD